MHIHRLDGCAPTPLAHYLKALGILRLVGEQADESARGWWQGERFFLATRLSAHELTRFFEDDCAPIPAFNPWGGRSGFYSGSSETSARTVLVAIERSPDARLDAYRTAIRAIRQVIAEVAGGKKPSDELTKERLVAEVRKALRGSASTWLDSVVATLGVADGKLSTAFPALFGTGGNEGSGSYTSAYMDAVVETLVLRKHNHALPAVLFGQPLPAVDANQNLLQFLPEGTASPWDIVLVIAGATLVRSSVVARGDPGGSRWMASPFYVAPSSFGYASAARLDEFFLQQGQERPGRGEQWFPLWEQPTAPRELAHLFAEGRAACGVRRANDGWSMGRAAASLGVRRGIRSFQRYGYLQRDNLSLHFAVSLGRFDVPTENVPSQACLDDLGGWLSALRRFVRDKDSTARLRIAQRQLMNFLFEVQQRPQEPGRWQDALIAMGELEGVMKTGSGFKAQPIPALRPEWAQAADDGSAEFRLALAFALQARAFGRDDGRPLDAIRRHWLPLDQSRRRPRFATTGDAMRPRLDLRPEVVMHGRSGIDDAIALVERRLVEAASSGSRGFPLRPAPRAFAHMADLAGWLAGRVDADRTLLLARALMALDGHSWAEQIVPVATPGATTHAEWPDDAWLAVRLAHLPWKLSNGREVPCDPAILRRLAGGDAGAAVELSLRRLRGVGIRASVRLATVASLVARRWAAALAFPITASTAARLVRRLDPSFAQEQLA